MREARPIHWQPLSTPSTGEHIAREVSRGAVTRGRDPETGLPTLERLPALCHGGDDYESRQVHPRARSRFVVCVRHDGHVVAITLTNASADLNLTSGYANYVRMKARSLGWFPFVACCPVRELKAKRLRRDRVRAPELLARGAKVCSPERLKSDRPCPHAIAERDARRAAHAVEQEKQLEPLLRADREAAATAARSVQTLEQLTTAVTMLASKEVAGAAARPAAADAETPPRRPRRSRA
jgi:hypothetical protein